MAINKNHEFDELDGIKCAVVEKNVSADRAEFLKDLLVCNGFTVVLVPTPPPKTAAAAKPATPDGTEETVLTPMPEPAAPQTFTLGVTDVSFNVTNAIFGRLLKTKQGYVVTQAYWNQDVDNDNDTAPYFEHTALAK